MMDREAAAALIGAAIAESHYQLDDKARVVRDRHHPELADEVVFTRHMISHHVSPAALLPILVRRHRLRADGVVESIEEHPERSEIALVTRALRRAGS